MEKGIPRARKGPGKCHRGHAKGTPSKKQATGTQKARRGHTKGTPMEGQAKETPTMSRPKESGHVGTWAREHVGTQAHQALEHARHSRHAGHAGHTI